MQLKRAFDAAVAAALLAVLSPVMAAIALAIRLIDGPPVVFRQERIGLGGHTFLLLKFRTMSAGRRSFAPDTDAVRITPLGRRLRSTSLDELPTLWNVVRGDMSLVGPRPLPEEYRDRYTPEQFRRHEVRPGVTGRAQVEGRNLLSWDQRFALDIDYVDNRTFVGDLRLLVRTVLPVLTARGVAADDAATMTEFKGQNGQTGQTGARAENGRCSAGGDPVP